MKSKWDHGPWTRFSFGEWNARFVFRYAGWILGAIALLCTLAFPFAKKLELRANFFELLPQNSPSVVDLRELTRQVGGTTFLICVIESSDSETASAAASQFRQKAANFPEVDYVDDQADTPEIASRKLLFLDYESVKNVKQNVLDLIAHYRRQANPLFVDLLEEEAPKIDFSNFRLENKIYGIGAFARKGNSAMHVVMIKPKHTVGDFAESRSLIEAARKTFDDIKQDSKYPVTMGLAGPYVTREAEYRTINGDVKVTGTAATILITLIMIAAFRNIRYLIYAYLPLGAGILLTLGFTELTIGYLNMITAFLVSILLGMGSDYTLHMLVNFSGDFRSRSSVYSAVKRTYTELWRPLLMSMLTTAVAFGAMTISSFEGYRHFGIIAGVGILISFATVFYGLPSLIIVGEKFFPRKKGVHPKPHVISKRQASLILIAGVLFSIYSIAMLPKARFDYDFGNLQAKNEDTIVLSDRMADYFGIQLSPIALIAPDRKRAAVISKKINRYIEEHPDSSFDFAVSLLTHVPQDQEEKISVMRETGEIIEKRKVYLAKLGEKERKTFEELQLQLAANALTENHLPTGLTRQYEGTDGKVSIVYVYPKGRIVDGVVTKRFVEELRSLDFGADVKLAGDPMLFADVLHLLERDTPVVMTMSLVTIIGLLLLHFRRLDHVLWVLAPVVLGFLWMTGMAAAWGLRYNFINLAILPSVLGVGIDSGIYIFDRFKNRSGEGFYSSLQQTSRGVILSSLTNISAFVSLSFANHRGMASMGLLGVFGFLSCMLAAVYFVPALIECAGNRTRKSPPPVLYKKQAA